MDVVEITHDGDALPLDNYPPDPITVSFFVPCYNEEKHVTDTVETLVTVTNTLKLKYEILGSSRLSVGKLTVKYA